MSFLACLARLARVPESRASRLPALAFLLALGTGCNSVLLGSGYDDGPQIADNGISVPVPPPSLRAAPVQEVDIEGELDDRTPEPKTEVHLWETTSEQGFFGLANADGTFRFEGVELDLTDNCIEVWAEEPGAYGHMTIHSFFHAYIGEDDQSVVTEQFFSGC